jgi:hypothetical protein
MLTAGVLPSSGLGGPPDPDRPASDGPLIAPVAPASTPGLGRGSTGDAALFGDAAPFGDAALFGDALPCDDWHAVASATIAMNVYANRIIFGEGEDRCAAGAPQCAAASARRPHLFSDFASERFRARAVLAFVVHDLANQSLLGFLRKARAHLDLIG